jgi:hypothetical protein
MIHAVRCALLVVLVAACQLGSGDRLASAGGGGGSGSGSSGASECSGDGDCTLAAATCCACPTFAVPQTDPAHLACADVTCPPNNCPNNVRATCTSNTCTLTCVAMTCAQTCAAGFAVDATGCLSCTCASGATECMLDTDCTRVRADCCGCPRGGRDTAVPNSLAAQHDAALGCAANPQCPPVDTCPTDLAVRCVRGTCELVEGAGGLPANACGRADLPACSAGTVCTVNSDPTATMAGVGVCLPG